jgi:membrane-bound serine protease (ClpP class)
MLQTIQTPSARFARVIAAAAVAAFLHQPEFARADGQGPVVVVDIKGIIGVSSDWRLTAALDHARKIESPLVVVRLDTPGGLVSSTRTMIQSILASPVPVVTYVAPSGARAASAGTYIAYASAVAAMAPGTHLGAATPIQFGAPPGIPGAPRPSPGDKDDKSAPDQPSTAMERKAINDAVAYIRSLAQMRGRNADWAEKAVREAATLTADEALKQNVVDIVARDLDELLAKVDGRVVTLGASERRLAIEGREIQPFKPDWRTDLLGVIADPNIAFLLMLAGIYGIMFELWHPGVALPGVLGAISLVLGLTALAVLPVNYGALALVLLGLGLMVAEAFVPGVGALGIGGLVAFVLGALFLFDPSQADFDLRVALPVVIATALSSALLLSFVLGFAVRARGRSVATGAEKMIGSVCKVIDWDGERGRVRVNGEVWAARGDRQFHPGDTVRIARRDGLVVHIESP